MLKAREGEKFSRLKRAKGEKERGKHARECVCEHRRRRRWPHRDKRRSRRRTDQKEEGRKEPWIGAATEPNRTFVSVPPARSPLPNSRKQSCLLSLTKTNGDAKRKEGGEDGYLSPPPPPL